MNVFGSDLIIERRDYFEIANTAWQEDYENISDPEKLLACIYRLSEKQFFTSAHLRDLIDMWRRRFGYWIGTYSVAKEDDS